ncbi:hypothetical protein [Ruegeria sediminis]|uniref:hypothetical protein n=1 Tax=Ruegeria sediminis TaxID=2583820 RepID=UPI001C5577BE|nr:hypothetical protein [Ruegeria sediminis]
MDLIIPALSPPPTPSATVAAPNAIRPRRASLCSESASVNQSLNICSKIELTRVRLKVEASTVSPHPTAARPGHSTASRNKGNEDEKLLWELPRF